MADTTLSPPKKSAPATLFAQLQPLACKATGDGACGLYSITHAVAELCAEGEENAKKKPGDEGIALRYRRLRRRLEETVYRNYRDTHAGETFDDFIRAFTETDPVNREKGFAPYFRELYYRHIRELDADGFKELQDELGDKRTKEEYIQYLRDNAKHWFQKNELTRILSELGVNAEVYQPVDASTVVKLFSEESLGIGPAKKYPFAGEIGLIHYRNHQSNKDLHWEWIAQRAATAIKHNAAHPYELWYGKSTASNESSTSNTASSSLFGSGDLFKIPAQFQDLFKQFGFTDDSAWSKGISLLVNLFMMMMGIVKTVTRWLNPDEPLDTEELNIPGAAVVNRAVKALGKAGEGLNREFRGASKEDKKKVVAKAIKTLVDDKQYDLANELLKEQEAELLKAMPKVRETISKVKESYADEIVAECENDIKELSDEHLLAEASETYKGQNFTERLACLQEAWAIHETVEEISSNFSVLESHEKELKALQARAEERKKLADASAAEWNAYALANGGEDHPDKFDPELDMQAAEMREKEFDKEFQVYLEGGFVKSFENIKKHQDKMPDFLPMHAEYVRAEQAKQNEIHEKKLRAEQDKANEQARLEEEKERAEQRKVNEQAREEELRQQELGWLYQAGNNYDEWNLRYDKVMKQRELRKA